MAYSPLGLVVTGTPIASIWGNQIKANFDALAGGATGQVLQAPGGALGWTATPTIGGLLTISAGGVRVSAGNVGIGGAPIAQIGLQLQGAILSGGTAQYGIVSQATMSSGATAEYTAIYAQIITPTVAFTANTARAFFVDAPSLGANSAVGNIYGMRISNQGVAGKTTNVYGVYIDAQSGGSTTNIALFNNGTSRFDGNIAMGTNPVTWATLYIGATLTSDGSTGGHSISNRNQTVIAAVNSDALFSLSLQNQFSLAGKTGVSCYGIHVSPSWAAAGANTGVYVAAVTAAGVNYGVYINAPSGGSTNIGLYNAGTSTLMGTVTFGTGTPAWTTANLGVFAAYGQFINTGGSGVIGLDNSTGGAFYGVAYALTIAHTGAFPIIFATSNTVRWQINASGHFIANTDNAIDIGAAGATRPRTIYAGTNVVAGGVVLASAGSFAATSLSFSGDPDTGLYSHAANVLGVSAGASTVARFAVTTLTLDAHLLFTDNTYDIGASGATRPRTAYLATSVAVGTNPATAGPVRLANAAYVTARNAANSANYNLIGVDASNLVLVGDVAVATQINAASNVFINVNSTSPIVFDSAGAHPGPDNTMDLGNGSQRWRDVYCARGAFNGSSRALKRDIAPFAPAAALQAIRDTEIVRYRYKPMGEDDANAERWHVGYIAEDAPDALSPDHVSVTPQTTASIGLAAIQEIARRLDRLEAHAAGGSAR